MSTLYRAEDYHMSTWYRGRRTTAYWQGGLPRIGRRTTTCRHCIGVGGLPRIGVGGLPIFGHTTCCSLGAFPFRRRTPRRAVLANIITAGRFSSFSLIISMFGHTTRNLLGAFPFPNAQPAFTERPEEELLANISFYFICFPHLVLLSTTCRRKALSVGSFRRSAKKKLRKEKHGS